jgi:hypothetical protein
MNIFAAKVPKPKNKIDKGIINVQKNIAGSVIFFIPGNENWNTNHPISMNKIPNKLSQIDRIVISLSFDILRTKMMNIIAMHPKRQIERIY